MSHEGGSEGAQQRTVAELLAKYGAGADERAPRRRRRRQDDPTDTAPQTIIERVNSESAKLTPIRDDTPAPRRTSHRRAAPPPQPAAEPRPAERRHSEPRPAEPRSIEARLTESAEPGADRAPRRRRAAPDARPPLEPRRAETRRPDQRPHESGPAEPRRSDPRPAEPRRPEPRLANPRIGDALSAGDPLPADQRPAEHRPSARSAAPPSRVTPAPPALPPVPRLPAITQSEPTRPVADPKRPLADEPRPTELIPPVQDQRGRRSGPPQPNPSGAFPRPDAPPQANRSGAFPRVPGPDAAPQANRSGTFPRIPGPDAPPHQAPSGTFPRPPGSDAVPPAGHPGSGYFPAPAPPVDANGNRPEAATEQLPRVPPGASQSGTFPPARAAFGQPLPPAPPLRPERNGAEADQYPDPDLDLDEIRGSDEYADYPDVDEFDDDYIDDEEEAEEDRSPAREWLVMVGQVALGVVGGAGVWLGFNWLWAKFPTAALIAALPVIVGLVWIVRKVRRADDLQTTGLAVLVGLFVTVSPVVLVLLRK